MQSKSMLLLLFTVASGTSIHALVTKTVTSPISTRSGTGGDGSSCNWCSCLSALAAEGVACAIAATAEGCNIEADLSCVTDTIVAVTCLMDLNSNNADLAFKRPSCRGSFNLLDFMGWWLGVA
ncbi:hypothetical protein B0H14DRAFT_2591217 [Mycena olivaceomarginata]|nr:hypothetical protein B0H14DRAFT_2591217 [Mycena olivaceomarginata]